MGDQLLYALFLFQQLLGVKWVAVNGEKLTKRTILGLEDFLNMFPPGPAFSSWYIQWICLSFWTLNSWVTIFRARSTAGISTFKKPDWDSAFGEGPMMVSMRTARRLTILTAKGEATLPQVL